MILDRFWSKVEADGPYGCWEWTASKRTGGYGQLKLNGRIMAAHRFSYELHCGAIPDGLHCLHTCDNRACVNPVHLFLGSNTDNVSDMVAKGRQARGSAAGRAKITELDVLAIREASGITQSELAIKFGIEQRQVSRIRAGKSWVHI